MAVHAKKKPMAELPQEVIHEEILTRLPIESVMRFSSVCKTWLSLFSDPKFVKDHLARNSAQNPNDYDCLVASKKGRIVILSRYKETFVLPSDDYELVGSVRGLVCLRRGKNLALWNPSIHQSREFTLPPERYGDPSHIGLAFDHACNDYKVVVCYVSGDLRHASVYSAKSDSWSDVFIPDNVFPRTERNAWQGYAPKAIVKDCPYWTCPRYSSNSVFLIQSLAVVKFEVGGNEFKLFPEFNFGASQQTWERSKHYQLVTMKDCLTLMTYKPSKHSIVDVYSLDEEGSCDWSKMYSVGPFDFHTHYLLLSQGFRYGGEIVCHVCGKFVCYDPKTKTVKRLSGTTHLKLGSCFTYVPSLVYLQGMNSVYGQTQARISSTSFRTPRRLISSLRG